MKRPILFTLAFVTMVSLACSSSTPEYQTIKGSGQVTSEIRPVSGFTGVELQTVGDVTITIGAVESVVVEADDNILRLLETVVAGRQLLIGMRANTRINVRNPIHFAITMKTLENASVSGSGNIQINGLDTNLARFDLPGAGSITANGKVKTLQVSLPGTGNIVCDGLGADTVIAELSGAGEITVSADHVLIADITGVGSINYSGDPANVTRTITGYGNINKLPQEADQARYQ